MGTTVEVHVSYRVGEVLVVVDGVYVLTLAMAQLSVLIVAPRLVLVILRARDIMVAFPLRSILVSRMLLRVLNVPPMAVL